jgi:hypothetical protein
MAKNFFSKNFPFLTITFLLLALLIWAGLMQEFRLDDSFITYRYARNVAQGNGLIYNLGETVLSTTAPLYALLLALLSFIVPDFHILGGLVGVIAIGAGAVLLADALARALPKMRWLMALVYVLASPLWLSLGMETALWVALVLGAWALARRERWGFAGLCIGIAMLTRPDAVLAGGLLGLGAIFHAITRRATTQNPYRLVLKYAFFAGVPVVLFYGWAWLTYGSPFPVTLSAKSGQAVLGVTGFGAGVTTLQGLQYIAESLMRQTPLYVAFLVLMVLGIFGGRRLRLGWAWLLVLWCVGHLLAYLVLGVSPYRWYYVPLLPGALILVARGFAFLYMQSRLLAYGAVALIIMAQLTSFAHIARYFNEGGALEPMLPVVDWQAYREAGEWINDNAPADALIGVAEVGQLGFYAQRTMTDYLGLLQPDVADMLRRDDLYSWLVGYAPDYLVFQRFGGGVGLTLFNRFIQDDPFFVTHYAEAVTVHDARYQMGPVSVFERTTTLPALQEHTSELPFGGLLLTGWAHDATIQAGDVVRLRFDWRIVRDDLPERLQISLHLLDAPEGMSITHDNGYATGEWGDVGDSLSNWHILALPEDLPSGDYPLRVVVWNPANDAQVSQVVGVLSILPS